MERNRSLFKWLIIIESFLLLFTLFSSSLGEAAGGLLAPFIFIVIPSFFIFLFLILLFIGNTLENRHEPAVIKRFKIFWLQISIVVILWGSIGLVFFE